MLSNVFDVGGSHVGAVALSRRIIYPFNNGHFPRQIICASEGAGTLKGLSWITESSENCTISGHSASLSWLPSLPARFVGV